MSWIYAHTCIHTYVCAAIHVCVYIYMYIYIYIRPRTCVCAHTHIYMWQDELDSAWVSNFKS